MLYTMNESLVLVFHTPYPKTTIFWPFDTATDVCPARTSGSSPSSTHSFHSIASVLCSRLILRARLSDHSLLFSLFFFTRHPQKVFRVDVAQLCRSSIQARPYCEKFTRVASQPALSGRTCTMTEFHLLVSILDCIQMMCIHIHRLAQKIKKKRISSFLPLV